MPKSFKRYLLASSLTVFALFGPSVANAGYPRTCGAFFSSPSESFSYGEIRSDFKHTNHYDKVVPHQSDVKDQCALSLCHMHAWVSELEHDYKRRTGQEIELNTDYLTVMTWFRNLVLELKDPSPKVAVELGASPIASLQTIREAGVMPASAWSPKIDISQPRVARGLTEYAASIIARAKIKMAAATTKEKRDVAEFAAMTELDKMFDEYIGNFSFDFTYEGKAYKPTDFLAERFPEINSRVVAMVVKEKRKAPTEIAEAAGFTVVSTDLDTMENTMRQLIDKNMNVYLGFEANDSYMDYREGFMSISAFRIPKNGQPLSRAQRNQYNLGQGGHAVQVVGYELDRKTGRVKKWLIKNSYGTTVGTKGYMHMYADYFRAFVRQVVYQESANIPLPEGVPMKVDTDPQLELPFPKPEPKVAPVPAPAPAVVPETPPK